jgi:hypothetical protein
MFVAIPLDRAPVMIQVIHTLPSALSKAAHFSAIPTIAKVIAPVLDAERRPTQGRPIQDFGAFYRVTPPKLSARWEANLLSQNRRPWRKLSSPDASVLSHSATSKVL